MADETHSSGKQHADTHHTFTHRSGGVLPPFPGRNQGDSGRARTTRQGARKKERSKTDLRLSVLRTGEKTKLGEELGQPGRRSCRMEGGLVHCWPSGVEGIRGLGWGLHSVLGGAWHEEAACTYGSPTHAPKFRAE